MKTAQKRKRHCDMKIGFDNDKYIRMQSAHIQERIAQFGGKLYLEFGGKLYDDYHASRVLPGFRPDSKLQMLLQLKDQVEIVIAINAADIEKNKVRGDLGITYDRDVIRLIDIFRGFGLYVSSVVLTRFSDQTLAKAFQSRSGNAFSSQDLPPKPEAGDSDSHSRVVLSRSTTRGVLPLSNRK